MTAEFPISPIAKLNLVMTLSKKMEDRTAERLERVSAAWIGVKSHPGKDSKVAGYLPAVKAELAKRMGPAEALMRDLKGFMLDMEEH